jgi:hypothetical protein
MAAPERGTASFILGDEPPSPKVFRCCAEVQYVVKKWELLIQDPRAESLIKPSIKR